MEAAMEVWIRENVTKPWTRLAWDQPIETARAMAAEVRAEGWDAFVYVGRASC